MSNSPRPRIIHITHASGEFLVRFNMAGTEDEALQFAFEQLTERWDLDVEAVRIATDEDVKEAQGQYTDLDSDV